MPSRAVSPVAVLIGAAALVRAQSSTFPATPLASKHFAYPSEIVCFDVLVLAACLIEFFSLADNLSLDLLG